MHRSCILLHSPNWAVWAKVAECYRNVYYTSPLTLKLEKNIPVHLSVIYPRKKKAKGLLSPSHFSKLCLWTSFTTQNLVSLQTAKEQSLKYLSVGSHYIWCLFLTKKYNLVPCSTLLFITRKCSYLSSALWMGRWYIFVFNKQLVVHVCLFPITSFSVCFSISFELLSIQSELKVMFKDT